MLTPHAPLVGADWAWRTLVEPSTYSINAMSWGTVELGCVADDVREEPDA